MKIFKFFSYVVSCVAFISTADATIVAFENLGLNNASGTSGLVTKINEGINPLGATFVLNPGNGLQLENTDLSSTGSADFILNFDEAQSSVRVQATNNKDGTVTNQDAFVSLFAFDTNIIFGSIPATSLDDSAVQIGTSVAFGAPRALFDVLVTGSGIRSVLVTSNTFITAYHEFEFDASVSTVPLPAALPLFLGALAGLGGFGIMKRRRGNAT